MNATQNLPALSAASKPAVTGKVVWYTNEREDKRLIAGRDVWTASLFETEVLELCTGNLSAEEIAFRLNCKTDSVLSFLEALNRDTPGAVTLLSHRDYKRRERALRAAAKMYGEWLGLKEVENASEYHREGISDPWGQFEIHETTISHLFRIPHPALKGRSYGEAFADRMIDAGFINQGAQIMEIGCGTGIFARDVLNRLRQRRPLIYNTVNYTLFDLSPALQSSQKDVCAEHQKRTAFIEGDILRYDFNGCRFNLVISNEMTADLPVSLLCPGKGHKDADRSWELIERYNLPVKNSPFLFNSGCVRFMEIIKDILLPAGAAVIVEYGSMDEFPAAVELYRHREHSIHFGHIGAIASGLFDAYRICNLGEYLGFDGEFEIIDSHSFDLVSNLLLPAIGCPSLPRIAFGRKELAQSLGDKFAMFRNIKYLKLKDRAALSPWGFLVLEAKNRVA